ncbi:hypothetical protein Lesp01_85380 [Lentzea sp. NBRC 102530]|nr:hypothetical protein Lesp01_85380 [Lentzea sp. NBRC 102530]
MLDRANHKLLSAWRVEAVHAVATRDRTSTYATAAQELGVTTGAVKKAVIQHRKTIAPADGQAVKPASLTVAEQLLQHATATGRDEDWQLALDTLRAAGSGALADHLAAARAEGRPVMFLVNEADAVLGKR